MSVFCNARVHVGNVIALGMEEGFAELEPAKYRVVLEDESYYGEIEVGVRFTTQREMSKGELEVLLVDAEGLAGADVIGE
ncbi:hypothetical protein GW17_00039984 [Ensete ventricosum]|nr:hypothetical protein GW17_00039984 [Ensete ventricosum]